MLHNRGDGAVDAEGYGFVLSDRWAVRGVTRHLLNIQGQEVTGADVHTLQALAFHRYKRVNLIAS